MEKTVAQTVVLELETSNKKNKKVQEAIDEYSEMTRWMSSMMASIDENQWSTMNSTLYRMITDEFDDRLTNANTCLQAIDDVVGSFKSWKSNGKKGKRPVFSDLGYISIKADNIDIEKNDTGYGIRLNFIPWGAEWFGIKLNPFAEKYLEKLMDSEAESATCELHKDDDDLYCHLVVKWDIEVESPEEKDRVLGVDIGENVIYASAVVENDEVKNVEIQKGEEFRHYRERLKKRRAEMMERDDLKGVKECSGEHERYTQQVLDVVSREIVDTAVEYDCAISLEDLTGIRNHLDNPIHDWPYADLQEKIMYKAKAKSIPVETVDPRNTSKECRKCGNVDSSNRYSVDFCCTECGYEVHADVNGAINIARRLIE